jgi:hypothetical protein
MVVNFYDIMKPSFVKILIAMASITTLVHAAEPAISLSLAIPAIDPGTERAVVAFDRNSHFPVILTNTSNKPQRIITQWNSSGDHTLRFEITDSSGKKSLAQAVTMDYPKNKDHWWILQPQESVVFDVYFADPNRWEGFPHPVHSDQPLIVTMRAVFEFDPATKTRADGLWSGSVFSKPQTIAFYNRMPEK